MTQQDSPPNQKLSGWCPQTSWTRVYRIHEDGASRLKSKALDELCKDYRLPVFKAFRLKHHYNQEDAEDAVQEFFIWFLDSQFVLEADHTRGKFRTFLLTYLDNFARNRTRKLRRETGAAHHLSVHDDSRIGTRGLDVAGDGDPVREIHLAWARSTLDATKKLLERSEVEAGRGEEWEVIRSFLSSHSEITMESAASKLGISLENVKVKVHRLRKGFYSFLSDQVSATVSTEEEFDQEMAFLRDVFA